MHNFGFALFPETIADVRAWLDPLIKPYWCELEVPEYKRFWSDKQALLTAKHRGAGDDLQKLVSILHAAGETDCGLEDGRFYQLSTYNPNAHWDYRLIGGGYDRRIFHEETAQLGKQKGWDEDICENICRVQLLPENVHASIIITPDGQWHTSENFGCWLLEGPEYDRAWSAWLAHAQSLLIQYPTYIALGLDIHS
ncbi:hypothetical protein EI77_00825 [Prosthecobacter fusiformis]|uniref:Uncharacterized protein n=1 Tax=Prosthecobacter fusiformis TaxID=48464 RepID=A0A4R7SS14_9BACT|nr:hypothetical protein [Prosthecobacter fusiformis]TDU81515.1 hypothetical protein EI77_00825 [Prosthecobacter fusiformis]